MKTRNDFDQDYLDIAESIDNLIDDDIEVTDWEAEFLESVLPVLRAKQGLTNAQERVLDRMNERYLFR